MRVGLVVIVVASTLTGCASGSSSNADNPETPATAETVQSAPIAVDLPSTPSATSVEAAEPTGPATRELTASDCNSLADKYGELTRSDEMAKLSPKLTDKQREQGRVNIGKGAEILSGRWAESCIKDLTGKLATESALRCAMAAKTVAAFDVCINGPATPAP